MKRALFISTMILSIFAYSAGIASAADFSVSASQPETIYAGNTTTFLATITNNGADDWFSVAALGTYPSWVSVEGQNLFVPSGSSASSKIWVTPVPDALPNSYEYSIIVSRASDNARVEKQVLVNVLQSNSVIISESSLSCSACKPAEMVTASVTLKNIGSRPLANMKLVFTMGDRTKTMPVASLDFGAVKTFSTDFSLDPNAAPGEYKIDARLMQDTLVIVQKSLLLTVPSISEIKTSRDVSSSIFGNYVTLVSVNQGNAAKTAEIKADVLSAWYSLFSGPAPSSVKGSEYAWSVSLAPNESITIRYAEIYWPVSIALIILVFAGAYYYITKTSVSIRKRVMRRHAVSEGKEVSVSLDVRSGLRPLDNVVVRDVVPREFSVSERFETIKPVIRKIASGTELVWRLGRLKSREERVLHYKMKAGGVSGTVRLHPAELSGKRGDKLVSLTSNFVALQGEGSLPKKSIKVVAVK